ncbi:hypothetical protein LY625_13265 [Lysobacter sp. GX 14042]|uniref:hypothetical protein n=1 Tax=Lysobacter sp. GX 14042 TaxID=2907155 RepID=UPI001F339730|nr:hypothetical protein [Lysobacter sp. GX 14042]MCE7033566.1 hypothetical protein [Lysobacter sp. GX 14042]
MLRYTKHMAEKACHVFGSATQVGLTQVLGVKHREGNQMALISCHECKQEISDSAPTCPKCGAKTVSAHDESFLAGIFAVGILALILWWAFADGDDSDGEEQAQPRRELALAEEYPGPWREDFNADIARTLAHNRVTGCGQFKFKPSSQNRNEFVVYCTRDGHEWSAYVVWTAINEVIGPSKPDPALN